MEPGSVRRVKVPGHFKKQQSADIKSNVTVMFNVWIGLFSDVNMAAERRQSKPQSRPSPTRR